MKVNGVPVRKKQPIRKDEVRVYVASFVIGFALGTNIIKK